MRDIKWKYSLCDLDSFPVKPALMGYRKLVPGEASPGLSRTFSFLRLTVLLSASCVSLSGFSFHGPVTYSFFMIFFGLLSIFFVCLFWFALHIYCFFHFYKNNSLYLYLTQAYIYTCSSSSNLFLSFSFSIILLLPCLLTLFSHCAV